MLWKNILQYKFHIIFVLYITNSYGTIYHIRSLHNLPDLCFSSFFTKSFVTYSRSIKTKSCLSLKRMKPKKIGIKNKKDKCDITQKSYSIYYLSLKLGLRFSIRALKPSLPSSET